MWPVFPYTRPAGTIWTSAREALIVSGQVPREWVSVLTCEEDGGAIMLRDDDHF